MNNIFLKDKIEIKIHVYDIPQRLKNIDPGLFVIFEEKTGKYEIHNSNNLDSTYCFSVDELDERVIKTVQKTKVENLKKIIAEMKKNNAQLEKDRKNKFEDYIHATAGEIYDYVAPKSITETIDKTGAKHLKELW